MDNKMTYKDFMDSIQKLEKENVTPKDKNFYLIIAPYIWNGFWYIKERSKLLRWVGRRLHNKYIYALGLHVEWIGGLKEFINLEGID